MSAEDRRELVLDAATGAFALGGYHGTSTDAVARQAGVSQPYVVRIFGTKLELFLEVFERSMERIGRAFTDDEGHFEFWTREPGGIGGRAAFYAAIVFARGLPDKLHTRIYVPGDDAALAADPLLTSLTPQERATVVATRTADGGLRHDIRLQGENETVFLAF